MVDCSCSISVDADILPELCTDKTVKARKTHKCCECRRDIVKGENYRLTTGKWDGEFSLYKTCTDCQSVIDQFFDNWTFEEIWEDLQEMIADQDGEINQACVAKLTPRARGMVCDIIERIWREREESGWYD